MPRDLWGDGVLAVGGWRQRHFGGYGCLVEQPRSHEGDRGDGAGLFDGALEMV